jgi:hypothetical protein
MAYANKRPFHSTYVTQAYIFTWVWLVFNMFVDSIHNVSPQEVMEYLWHINELKANSGI